MTHDVQADIRSPRLRESTFRSYGIGTCCRFICWAHILIGEPAPIPDQVLGGLSPEYALTLISYCGDPGKSDTRDSEFTCAEVNFILNRSAYSPAPAKRLRNFDCAKNDAWPRSIIQVGNSPGYPRIGRIQSIRHHRIDSQRKTPAETPGFIAILFNQPPDLLEPPGAAEPIVYAGFENVKFIVAQETVTAEVHHVVLKLRSPVVPQGIFGSEAEHPSTDSLVYRP